MAESPHDILRRVARMPKDARQDQREDLIRRYQPQLTVPLHRQILDCLVGRPCKSLAAKSWAASLVREEAKSDWGGGEG